MMLWQWVIWVIAGVFATGAIYAMYVRYGPYSEIRPDPKWCPSPGGIFLMLVGVAMGWATAILLILVIFSHALTRLSTNDRFWLWLTTPVCDKRMPVPNDPNNKKT